MLRLSHRTAKKVRIFTIWERSCESRASFGENAVSQRIYLFRARCGLWGWRPIKGWKKHWRLHQQNCLWKKKNNRPKVASNPFRSFIFIPHHLVLQFGFSDSDGMQEFWGFFFELSRVKPTTCKTKCVSVTPTYLPSKSIINSNQTRMCETVSLLRIESEPLQSQISR